MIARALEKASMACCEQCRCGIGFHKPCKNKATQVPSGSRQAQGKKASVEEQVQQLQVRSRTHVSVIDNKFHFQAFVQELEGEDLRRLYCRLLGTWGGISLARSLLEPPPGPRQPGGDNGPDWCVCGNCRDMGTPRENGCAEITSVSPHMTTLISSAPAA